MTNQTQHPTAAATLQDDALHQIAAGGLTMPDHGIKDTGKTNAQIFGSLDPYLVRT